MAAKEVVETLYGYLETTSDASTSGAAASKSDENCRERVSDSSESSDSGRVEPGPKRLRKAIASHHRKPHTIPQAWTREYRWLCKVRVAKGIGMVCELCKKHAILPRSGCKV